MNGVILAKAGIHGFGNEPGFPVKPRMTDRVDSMKYAEIVVLVDNISIPRGDQNKFEIEYAEVAQLAEHSPEERRVTSANLVLGTKFCG